MATLTQVFTAIADAIRTKSGTSVTYTPTQMPNAILNLPSGGDGDVVKLIERDFTMFENNEFIDDEITKVGKYALSNFTSTSNLKVQLNNCLSVEEGGFRDTEPLAIILLPSCTTIGDYAFTNCTRIATADFSAATSIGKYTFSKAFALNSSIDFPEVTSIDTYAFEEAGLSSVSLPKVTSVQTFAFSKSKLTSISLPLCTLVGNYSFNNCTSLTTVSLPNITTINQGVFSGCSSLTSVNVPNVTAVGGNGFYGCTALTSLTLPNTTLVNSNAFYNCTALTSLILSKVQTVSYGFVNGCSSLGYLDLGSDITTIANNAFQRGYTTGLNKIILRTNQVVAFSPTSSYYLPGTAGNITIYVPDDLVASYQSSTYNGWSLLYSENNNVFQPLSSL